MVPFHHLDAARAARVVHTRRLAYVFLVYNLVLAWIRLGLSVVAFALDGLRPR
jgi:hypothetical protein